MQFFMSRYLWFSALFIFIVPQLGCTNDPFFEEKLIVPKKFKHLVNLPCNLRFYPHNIHEYSRLKEEICDFLGWKYEPNQNFSMNDLFYKPDIGWSKLKLIEKAPAYTSLKYLKKSELPSPLLKILGIFNFRNKKKYHNCPDRWLTVSEQTHIESLRRSMGLNPSKPLTFEHEVAIFLAILPLFYIEIMIKYEYRLPATTPTWKDFNQKERYQHLIQKIREEEQSSFLLEYIKKFVHNHVSIRGN